MTNPRAREANTILVVDDDRKWRDLMRTALMNDHWQVVEAHDGVAAIRLLRENSDIAAILLDMLLPGLSGYAVARQIREDKTVRTVPIVFTSAHTPEEFSIVEPLAIGAFDVLEKEAGPKSIAGAIRIAVEATRAAQSNVGPQGPKGDKGERGDKGEPGAKGDTGARGE